VSRHRLKVLHTDDSDRGDRANINAGIAYAAPLEETSLEHWRRVQEVLLTGYFLVSREAVRIMKAQGTGGAIVFIASKNALVPSKEAAAYNAAKAAEVHLARTIAEEAGPISPRSAKTTGGILTVDGGIPGAYVR